MPAKRRLPRRTLLAGLGTTAAAALVRPMLSEAQAPVSPQRLLIIHRPDGTVPSQWFPTGGVTDWVTSPILSPFEPLRSQMVVMKGLDCPRNQQWLGDKHGAGMIAMMAPPPADKGGDYRVWPVLPGYTLAEQVDTNGRFFTSPDKTIDQLLLEKVPALRGAHVPSLQLTSSSESANSSRDCCNRVVSYAKPDPFATYPTPLWPESRPAVALQNIFGAITGMNPADVAKAQALNKSMLDFVTADLRRLQPRVPASQLPKIDAHLGALRAFEQSSTGGGPPCQAPILGPLPTAPLGAVADEVQFVARTNQHWQLIKAAFQCDLTRVISFSFCCDPANLRFSNILPQGAITDTEGLANISHNGGTGYLQAQQAIDTFFCQTTASLLLDMKNTPEGAGTMLDNTLVVFYSECSLGNSHDTRDMPVLAFGGKFLNLRGGSYLQLGTNARCMSDFWVETARAWGYRDLTTYGAPMWNKGPITGLYG